MLVRNTELGVDVGACRPPEARAVGRNCETYCATMRIVAQLAVRAEAGAEAARPAQGGVGQRHRALTVPPKGGVR